MRPPDQEARPWAGSTRARHRRLPANADAGDRESAPPGEGGSSASRSGGERRRLWLILGVGALLIAAAAGTATLVDRTTRDTTAPIPATIPLDAWTPYWALDRALPTLSERAGSIRQLSPFWYLATSADTIARDPHAPAAATTAMVAAARSHGLAVIPSVLDGMGKGEMAAVLADPTSRAPATSTPSAKFASDGRYDGLDIDYEQFAFEDDRTDWPDIRPNWVAFITELAARLHADGRKLTVSIPPIYEDGSPDDPGYWVYDYGAIAPHVDAIRIMAYDYSTAEPGPIAPIAWVRQAIEGAKRATKAPEKLVLGIPLYGYNWPTSVDGQCPDTEREGSHDGDDGGGRGPGAEARRHAGAGRGRRRVDVHLRVGRHRWHHVVHAAARGPLRRRRWGPPADRPGPRGEAGGRVAVGLRLRRRRGLASDRPRGLVIAGSRRRTRRAR